MIYFIKMGLWLSSVDSYEASDGFFKFIGALIVVAIIIAVIAYFVAPLIPKSQPKIKGETETYSWKR